MRIANGEIGFNSPIPGEGMTAKMGSFPWQNPPRLNTVEEVIEFYMRKMQEEAFEDILIEFVKSGTPLTVLVNFIHTKGIMQGEHTIDVAALTAPVLLEYCMYICDSAGISNYTSGLEDPKINRITSAHLKEVSRRIESASDIEEDMSMESTGSGLMSRSSEVIEEADDIVEEADEEML